MLFVEEKKILKDVIGVILLGIVLNFVKIKIGININKIVNRIMVLLRFKLMVIKS